MTKRIPLAVALSAFAMACSDPSSLTTPTRTLVPSTTSLALIPHQGYPFPSSTVTTEPNETDGLVRLCKVSNTAGTFNFDVQVNAGAVTEVSITVGAGQLNTPVCYPTALFNSDLPSAQVDQVLIVEDNPGANFATIVDIDQYYIAGITYHANALADQFNVAPRTARVFINDDMEKLVTFRNTFTPPPPPPVCDFITFGRLVWENGDFKVVISGNAGGNKPGGGILGEFHIEVNDVDHHVADISTYGPIAAAPLASATYTNSRRVTGTDKHGHAVELRLWDGGEPGKGTDRFWFSIAGASVGNATTGNLIDQGNMQYHPNCRGPAQD